MTVQSASRAFLSLLSCSPLTAELVKQCECGVAGHPDCESLDRRPSLPRFLCCQRCDQVIGSRGIAKVGRGTGVLAPASRSIPLPHPPEGASMTTSGPYDATGTSSATMPVTGTSSPTRPVTGTSSPTRSVAYRDDERRHARETKPSFKTTELIVYLLSVFGVLIASWVVDVRPDGQGFSAYQGWFLVTLLTIGYLISRGLVKSGSRDETR